MKRMDNDAIGLHKLSFEPPLGSLMPIPNNQVSNLSPRFQSLHKLSSSKCSESSITHQKLLLNSCLTHLQSSSKLSHEYSSFSMPKDPPCLVLPEKVTEEILITELNEDSFELNKKINISKIDNSVIGQNLETLSDAFKAEEKNGLHRGEGLVVVCEKVTQGENWEEREECVSINKSPTIRESLSQTIRKSNICEIIDFYQAYSVYSTLDFVIVKGKKLWKMSFFQRICLCCSAGEEIDTESLEICEKFLIFSFTAFDKSLIFHQNLLVSSTFILFNTQMAESSKAHLTSCLGRINCKTEIILLVFLNILFLSSFFPEILKALKESLPEPELLPILCEISKLNLVWLRKRKMNGLINRSQKCLEVIFFMFAGLCLYFLSLSQTSTSYALRKLPKLPSTKLGDVLAISQRYYKDHCGN